MSSLLHVTVKPATVSTIPTTQRRTAHSPSARKQKASLIQSYYYLAYTVRGKLLKEAAQVDHDLRLVVGHANLLDGLMLELANFEQEQEISFNNTVRSAANASEEPKQSQRVSLTDQLIDAKERAAEDEMYDGVKMAIPVCISAARPIQITITEDDDELDSEVLFTSTDSRSPVEHSPPDLVLEDSSDASDSEEDSIQPSLLSIEPFISEDQRKAITTTSFCQSPSKLIDCSFSNLKETSNSPMPLRGPRSGALSFMVWFTIQHSFSKQLKAMPKQASARAFTVDRPS